MRRFWDKAKPAYDGRNGWPPPPAGQAGPVEVEPELLEVDDGSGTRYTSRAVHPAAQLATRVGLWAAVALGCIGGVFGLIRPPVQRVEATAEQVDERALVPGPVAGKAEVVVEAWLTASESGSAEDDGAITDMFVEDPTLADLNPATLVVGDVTTVGGVQRTAGYWSVTVAADVVETVVVEDAEVEPGEPPETEDLASTWYVEVGIAGDVGGGLAAIAPPAVVPGPPPVDSDWLASAEEPRPAGDSELASTVEGFLRALLADGGDPTRYLAPGGEIEAMDPAPFEAIQLMTMSADELEDGQIRVLAEALVTTPGGARTRLAYEVVLGEWADRWEVTSFSGAPTMVAAVPEDEEGEGDASEDGDGEEGEAEDSDTGTEGRDSGGATDDSGTGDGTDDSGTDDSDSTDGEAGDSSDSTATTDSPDTTVAGGAGT